VQARIASLRPAENAREIDQQRKRLQDLERERDEITEQVRRTSPRVAALQYPRPLTFPAARKVLDPGTVLLSYSVGPDHTRLFVVQPGGEDPGISVFTLPIGEKALREQVNSFADALRDAGFQRQSRGLYDLLMRPAEQLIACGRRILICPDGPLDRLPFAALLRNENQYLIEWKPLHIIQSATLYAEVKGRRSSRTANRELVIFGDPQYPAAETEQNPLRIADSGLRGGSSGFGFARLRFTRLEANAIAALYPGQSRVFLGPEATEERAKSIGRDVRYLHFATHAVLDRRVPLNSALVLTIPEHPADGRDNGLLQAWEIFENVRIDADLVTLSGCQTGLGQEQDGEGLIGLTRAFLYAGAHSILASRWTVQDVSTAELMKRFYSHLKDGAEKDEALQQAQMELMHVPQFARPYYWAAFFLIGDPL
jgi:CHAT domain-containing protein